MALNPKANGLAVSDLTNKLKEIPRDASRLAGQLVRLAKVELADKLELARAEVEQGRRQVDIELEEAKRHAQQVGKTAGIGAGLFGAAALVGLAAFATFTTALVAAFAQVMPLWASALVVTTIYGSGAGALAYAGQTRMARVREAKPEAAERAGRIKLAASSTARRMRHEVPIAPESTLESLKDTKRELVDAWQRGSSQNGRPSDEFTPIAGPWR